MNACALPGTLRPATPPLRHYRPAEVHAALPPLPGGGLWLDVGTGNPAYIRELVQAGCRVIAVNLNPFTHFALDLALRPLSSLTIHTALSQLLDRPKAGQPLVYHLRALYQSGCPQCGKPGQVQVFFWERQEKVPRRKRVQCPACGLVEGPTDEADARAAERFALGIGPAYHLALHRATRLAPEQTDAIKALVALYPPRVLSVLMDLLPRVMSLPNEEERRAARALLVEVCDRSTSLWADVPPAAPPRSFHIPAQWVEVNPEVLLLQARAELLGTANGATLQPAPTLEALLASSEPGYVLLNWPLRQLRSRLTPGSLQGVVIHPPVSEALHWALSALWRCWLWDEAAPPALLAFLDRRRLDGEWARRALGLALRHVRDFLQPGAPVLLHTAGLHLPSLATAIAAAAEADLGIQVWGVSSAGARLRLGDAAQAPVADALTVESVVQARGQPTAAEVALACTLFHQKKEALRALRQAPKAEGLLTPTRSDASAPPLCERVELALWELLQERESWAAQALRAALYARFSGPLTPEPELVELCLQAYTQTRADGTLSLRAEDRAQARAFEVQQCCEGLAHLGQRLGFEVATAPGWDGVWLEEGAPRYAFRVALHATLTPVLAQTVPPGCRGVLVLPGSRAPVLAWRLARDTALKARLDRGWIVVKFRLLRRMLEELQTRVELDAYWGLDPLVEQDRAQLRLLV